MAWGSRIRQLRMRRGEFGYVLLHLASLKFCLAITNRGYEGGTMSDSLLICTNLLPIGTYFCILALIHATARPLVTTGRRNYLALALALSGLVINQPIAVILHSRLLPPAIVHNPWAGFVLYIVLVAAVIPKSYQTLVVYNASQRSVAAAVRAVLDRLGWETKELPGGWFLPGREVHLEIDTFDSMDNVWLEFRGLADRELYLQMRTGLTEHLSATRSRWSVTGLVLGVSGAIIVAVPVSIIASDGEGLASLVHKMLETW